MQITIRKFRKEDVIKVSNMIKRAQRITLKSYYPKKLIEAYCKWNNPKRIIERTKERKTFIAEYKKSLKIVGEIELLNNRIKTLFVDPKYQKKGVGRLLYERIKKEILKKGYEKIGLGSSHHAIPFYKKLGFKKVRKRWKEMDGIRHYDTWMEQKI